MKRKKPMMLLLTCIVLSFSLSAQQVPFDPLAPEPGQDKIETRKIPAAPVDERAAADLPSAKPEKTVSPVVAAPTATDEAAQAADAYRPIPGAPIDEKGGQPTAAKPRPSPAILPAAAPGGEETEAPLRKIPPKPVNENGQ